MKTRWFFTLLMIAALLRGGFPVGEASASTTSESDVWTSIGPEAGYIRTLAIDPATPTIGTGSYVIAMTTDQSVTTTFTLTSTNTSTPTKTPTVTSTPTKTNTPIVTDTLTVLF